MTTYIIPQGGAGSIDKTKLQYPCKVVDIDGKREFYLMSIDAEEIVTSEVGGGSVEPDIVTFKSLMNMSDEYLLGVDVSGSDVSLVALTYDEYGLSVPIVYRTVTLSEPLSFEGLGFFATSGVFMGLAQIGSDGKLSISGENDIPIQKAIEQIVSFFGRDFGEHTVVTAAGYRVADFVRDSGGAIIGIYITGPYFPELKDGEVGEVLVKEEFDQIGTIEGDTVTETRYVWRTAKVDDYGNIFFE